MLQKLQNFAIFQKLQLDNLVDFEKYCKTRIYLQRSAPIEPKTSEILPKICQKLAPTLRVGATGAVMTGAVMTDRARDLEGPVRVGTGSAVGRPPFFRRPGCSVEVQSRAKKCMTPQLYSSRSNNYQQTLSNVFLSKRGKQYQTPLFETT